jgi:hypothetical protein
MKTVRNKDNLQQFKQTVNERANVKVSEKIVSVDRQSLRETGTEGLTSWVKK